MQQWPLTGRTEELDAINDALSDALRCGGVAVTGAAGVGKTRLIREAADSALAKGWTVRRLAGTTAAQSVPLGAFAQWADRLDGHPLQLVGNVIAAVTASVAGAPVLVCVDDAHRLDDLSAFVVHQLVLRGSAKVLLTMRSGESVPDAVTALWKDGHLLRLDVKPLSRNQFDALLESVLGGPVASQDSAHVWKLTQGNALFLREIVTHDLEVGRLVQRGGQWGWSGPMVFSAALVELVDSQLDKADSRILDVVDMVALAEPLEMIHLAELADAEAIEESERRGLIAVSPGSPADVVSLGHPLFGEVRLARAGRWRLARLRARMAHVIAGSNVAGAKPDPVRLALLWLESNLPADGEVFGRAAQAAVQRMDLGLATRFARAALDAGGGPDTEIMLAQLYSLTSRGEEAEELLSSLTRRRLPDAAWITSISLRAANLLWTLGRPEESFAVIDDALTTSSPACSPALLAFKAVQLAVAARPAEAVRTADCVDPDQLEALPAMMRAWALTIAHGDVGNAVKAAAAATEGLALAAASPEVAFQGAGLVIYFADALALGGYPAAVQALAEQTDVQLTDVPGAARTNVAALNGFAALVNGRPRTASALLETAMSEYEGSASTVGTEYFFGITCVQTLAMAGDVQKAQSRLATIRCNQHPALVFVEPSLRLAEAWEAAGRGHLAPARAAAARGAEFARAHGQHAREVLCLQAGIQFGETQHAPRLAELTRLVEGPRAPLVADWAAAVADQDGPGLLTVSKKLEAMGDRIAAADAAAQASLAFEGKHRRGAAMTAAGRAASIIADCAARTPATRAAATPLPLSRREREVALLVSGGMSNRQIAATMMLSIRTVEGHVYQACRKLDVANRAELARVLEPLTG